MGGGVGGVEEEQERTALVSLRGMSWATLEVFGVGNAALGMVHKALCQVFSCFRCAKAAPPTPPPPTPPPPLAPSDR